MNVLHTPFSPKTIISESPSQCFYCKRYIPQNSSVRISDNHTFCPDHQFSSCQSVATEAFTQGNFSIQFDNQFLTFDFDPRVSLQYDDQCSVVSRSPITCLSLKRCFQIEIFHYSVKQEENQSDFIEVENVQDKIRLKIQFPEPAQQHTQNAQDQQTYLQKPTAFLQQNKLSQLQISPRYVMYKQTQEQGFKVGHFAIHVYLSYPPTNCRQLYYQYAVQYVLRADLAQNLCDLYPETNFITEEFSFLMFKPLNGHVCRIVPFDGEGNPIYSKPKNTIIKKEAQQELQQGEYQPVQHFSLEGNDQFNILNKEYLNESKVLIYVESGIEGDQIASSRRTSRSTAVFIRNYICMNQFMARYCYQQLYAQHLAEGHEGNGEYHLSYGQLNDNIQLLIPAQIVPCKLISELFSKFTPAQQAIEIAWDFNENFQNTYARFLDEQRNVVPIIIPLNSLNKEFSARQAKNVYDIPPPHTAQVCMMLDMHLFYKSLLKPPRGDEDRKLVGTSGQVLLEPYWANTYLWTRVSFPNYRFDCQTTIDLNRRQLSRQGDVIQLGSGVVQIVGQSFVGQPKGEYFEYGCLDSLLQNNEIMTVDPVLVENVYADISTEQVQDLTNPFINVSILRPKHLQLSGKNFSLDPFAMQVMGEEYGADYQAAMMLAQRNAHTQQCINVFAAATYDPPPKKIVNVQKKEESKPIISPKEKKQKEEQMIMYVSATTNTEESTEYESEKPPTTSTYEGAEDDDEDDLEYMPSTD